MASRASSTTARPISPRARTQALLKRMHTGALADARGVVLYGTPNGLRDLVLTWLEGKLQHTRHPFYLRLCGPMRFIDRRLRDLIRHLDRHGALPPLATPSHARGWIDPRILVDRLLGCRTRPLAGRRSRYGPRTAGSAHPLAGCAAGELTLPSLDLQVSPSWGGGSSAQPLQSPAGGLGSEARPGRRWRQRLVRALRAAGPAWALRSAEPSLSVPTCLAHEPMPQRSLAVGNSAPWLIEWALMLWPLKIDAALARGAGLMVERLDLGASASEPLHPFLEPLFEVNRPWSELARLTLWLALASRDGDLRRLATDLLIEGGEGNPCA
jgi:hypothetical protein